MRRRKPRSPLPQRDGLDAVLLRTPAEGEWSTFRDYLYERLPPRAHGSLDAKLDAGEFVGPDGPIDRRTPFAPGVPLWFHREPPPETPVPFDIGIVHHDERLLVVDKPHFLATMPRGRHVRQTALVRLRQELQLPDLSPAHRLDRPTAGLLMFTKRREDRAAYQELFARRRVHKEYEAIAPLRPDLVLPRTVRNRIVKERGRFAARTVPGAPNAETRIELLEERGCLGRYRLLPRTGRTHQLRLHLSELGIPILGDDCYPQPRDRADDDFSQPLQLLARVLEFTDPVTGRHRRFDSALQLRAWEDLEAWRTPVDGDAAGSAPVTSARAACPPRPPGRPIRP